MANRNLRDYRLNEIIDRLKERAYRPLRTAYRRTAPSRLLLARSYLLDSEWYLQQYPDVTEAGTTATKHYLRHGSRENRDPGPFFSTAWYRQQYPDVGQSDMNPLVHYLRFGEDEGRLTGPSFRRRRSANVSTSSSANENRGLKQKKQISEQLLRELDLFLLSEESLTFSLSDESVTTNKISVVLVTWNKAEFTLSTLKKLAAEDDVSIEVIIVDNGSTDSTPALLDRLKGVTIVRETSNLGFVKAVNIGAALAKGEYLLLLNNDAVPRTGAIAGAARFLNDEPEYGAVGGRLILPTGLLQEAGSIVWQDGSCAGYLRNEPPEIGEAMFRRSVDFCSAAFLMIRASKWLELGGFKDDYSPAYYEEVDFCCRLIQSGDLIAYLPDVVVDHFEFASTASMSTATEMQIERREIFRNLNKQFLLKQLPPEVKNVARARDRDERPSVLIIDDQVPRESAGQGFPRIVRLVKTLKSRGYRVCVAATAHEGAVNWADIWAEIGIDVEVIPDLSPRTLEAFLEERTATYDFLWVSRPHNLKYITEIEMRRPGLISSPVIYDAEALTTSNQLGGDGQPIDIGDLKLAARIETDSTGLASALVCVSQLDASVFETNTGKPTFLASHSLEVNPGPKSFADRSGVLFFGALSNLKSPNVAGINWLVDEVWPLVSAELRDSNPLRIAGQVLPSLAKKWSRQGIEVLGLVPDLSALANNQRIFIAPTRNAQGIPIKVLEAASYGLPSVITPILAQQLQWQNEKEALVAATPSDFALAIERLIVDEHLWQRLRLNATQSARTLCDPKAFDQSVLAAIDSVR